MTDVYVLDACAVIAFLANEEGALKVEELLEAGREGDVTLVMNKINLLEVYYATWRRANKETADQILQMIRSSPITVIDVLRDDVFAEAARLKAAYRISLADAIALAEAHTRAARLVTADHHEFDAVAEQEDVLLHWIR